MNIPKLTDQEPPRVEVRIWMARTGRRARDVARLIGVSDMTMSEYLRDKYDLNLIKTEELSRASGIPPERLVTDPRTSAALKRLQTPPKFSRGARARKTRNV
jgi:transcriptional regulator with XRE-family HTH domain